MIVHLGDTSSGHFITFRRGSMNNQQQSKWYYISDVEVKEVSFTEVSRSCAYMLFYESLPEQSVENPWICLLTVNFLFVKLNYGIV